jgi:hypothetical protein
MAITVVNNGAQITATVNPVQGPQGPAGPSGPAFSLNGLTFIDSLADLPTPVGNVITLPAGAYQFTSHINLNGNRLVLDGTTAIFGTSSETATITSTGLPSDQWLITTSHSLPMQNIGITDVQKGVRIIPGTGSIAADWDAVNFINVPESAWANDVTNFIVLNSAYLNAGGIRISGTVGTVGLTGVLVFVPAGETGLTLDENTVITRRVRVDVSPFITGTGATGINVPVSATIPNGGYIIHRGNFTGSGTAIAGILPTDPRAAFTDNVGIENTTIFGFLYMQGNATATTIAQANTPVKAAGITTNSEFTRAFTHTDNRLTYVGGRTVIAYVQANATMIAGNAQKLGVYIAKNGAVVPSSEIYTTTSQTGRSENASCQTPVQLTSGDYIEFWVENDAATTAITVQSLTLSVRA